MHEERKRKILITHLGGTIGMVRDPQTGSLRAPKDVEEFEKSVQKIIATFNKKYPGVEVEFACLSTVDSNDINPELLEEAVAYIKAREHEFDAVVATHGTDTMSSTLSALTLAFTDIDKIGSLPLNTLPIVATGAQASSFDEPQDATRNLTNALFAAERLCRDKYYQCVVQVFGSKIIEAVYTAKTDEAGDDAFDSVDERGRIGKCSSAKGPQFADFFLRRCHTLSPEQRETHIGYGAATGHPLPNNKFMISPLQQVKIDEELIGVPLEDGHYIHPVSAKTFGHSKSITLQAKDPLCLGVAFYLTGTGNAPYLYCDGIRDVIKARGVPIYGSLNINGGAASQDSYQAGARIHKAGVVTGDDASADHCFISMQWALANLEPDLDPKSFLTVLQAGHHMNWDNDSDPNGNKLSPIPDVFNQAATGEGSFTRSHKEMTSKMNAYRVWKQSEGILRWISVEDDALKKRVVANLPKANTNLILPTHNGQDFSALHVANG